jgi:hypothetical protein
MGGLFASPTLGCSLFGYFPAFTCTQCFRTCLAAPFATKPPHSYGVGVLNLMLFRNFARSDPADHYGGTDHVSGAFFTSGAFGHHQSINQNGRFIFSCYLLYLSAFVKFVSYGWTTFAQTSFSYPLTVEVSYRRLTIGRLTMASPYF